MPTPKPNEKEDEFIARCVPVVMGEGSTQEQALGKCYGIFRNARKSEIIDKTIRRIHKEILDIEDAELISKYEGEIDSAVSEMIKPESRKLFSKVYSRCRRDGAEQEKAVKIASACVGRVKEVKADTEVLKSIESIVAELAVKVNG